MKDYNALAQYQIRRLRRMKKSSSRGVNDKRVTIGYQTQLIPPSVKTTYYQVTEKPKPTNQEVL